MLSFMGGQTGYKYCMCMYWNEFVCNFMHMICMYIKKTPGGGVGEVQVKSATQIPQSMLWWRLESTNRERKLVPCVSGAFWDAWNWIGRVWTRCAGKLMHLTRKLAKSQIQWPVLREHTHSGWASIAQSALKRLQGWWQAVIASAGVAP